MGQQLRFLVHAEEALLPLWQFEPPREESGGDGHGVAIAQKRMGLKFRGVVKHLQKCKVPESWAQVWCKSWESRAVAVNCGPWSVSAEAAQG
ncbi:MAG: hypothetical protein PVS2B2_13490 [Candidatus Acidiferrum sp.]